MGKSDGVGAWQSGGEGRGDGQRAGAVVDGRGPGMG
jgi:hypothetical protein